MTELRPRFGKVVTNPNARNTTMPAIRITFLSFLLTYFLVQLTQIHIAPAPAHLLAARSARRHGLVPGSPGGARQWRPSARVARRRRAGRRAPREIRSRRRRREPAGARNRARRRAAR